MHTIPSSIVPFPYKYPYQPFVELTTAVPLTTFATPTNHHAFCDSLTATGAAAAAASRAAAAMHLSQHPSPPRSTQLRKSFTIEAILGLDSTKNGQMCNRVHNRDFCYPPVKENCDIRRKNRPMPYSFPMVQGNKQMTTVISDKEAKAHFEESFNASKPPKSKRVRTIFTPEQLERLESEFERQQYMVGPERLYLASTLNLTEAQVKVWFQNRRIKWRKQHLEMQQARLAKLRSEGDGQRFNELETSSEDEIENE